MLDKTLDTIAPVNEQEKADEMQSIDTAERDEVYDRYTFLNRLSEFAEQAMYRAKNDISGRLTSSSSCL